MADTNIAGSPVCPFPVQVRIIRFRNADGDPYISSGAVRADIAAANQIWRTVGLSFFILSDEPRSSAKYRRLETFGEFLELENEEWSPTNRWINVYYGDMDFASGVCSFPHPREAHAIAVHYNRNNTTLAHEFGHYFNLYHTFQDNLSDTDSGGNGDPKNVMSYNRTTDIPSVHLTQMQVDRAKRSLFRDRQILLAPFIETL